MHIQKKKKKKKKKKDFSTFPRYKSIQTQIWPCRKKVRIQSTFIIWTISVELETAMLYTKIQPESFLDSGDEVLRGFTMAAILF